jgi:N-sulfoglucosamine sulfohydrolase
MDHRIKFSSGILYFLVPSLLGISCDGATHEKRVSLAEASAAQRPNILFIVSEDNGPDLGCYGAPVNTPILDALAEGGIRFTNGYVSQAGCSPSRASFLTGLYPHQNGQVGLATWRYRMYNENTPNLVNDLKASGYRTGIIGKLHVNPESAFDFDFSEINSGNFARRDLDMYAKHAYDFFTSTDEPFYLQVNYPDAHTPFTPQVDGRPSEILTGADVEAMPLFGVTSDSLRQLTADYYNCMMRLDEMIGELLDNLHRSGKYENTLVVYIGDHGIDVIRGKRTCYEGGVRIPFIASWPASGTAGIVSEYMVSIIDIYPTFMDVSGSPVPEHLPGKSFLPLLTGGEYVPREYLFTEYHVHSNHNPYPQRAVRDVRYKLIYSPLHGTEHPDYAYTLSRKLDGEDFKDALTRAPEFVRQSYRRYNFPPEYELFDLLADPLEWHNLAEVPAYREVLERLKKVLREWQIETSDPMLDTNLARRFFDDVMKQGISERAYFPYHEYLDPKIDFGR